VQGHERAGLIVEEDWEAEVNMEKTDETVERQMVLWRNRNALAVKAF
jgi:PHD/YefM family antitoxin component YafN of YafNO toxin-antitoxin module